MTSSAGQACAGCCRQDASQVGLVCGAGVSRPLVKIPFIRRWGGDKSWQGPASLECSEPGGGRSKRLEMTGVFPCADIHWWLKRIKNKRAKGQGHRSDAHNRRIPPKALPAFPGARRSNPRQPPEQDRARAGWTKPVEPYTSSIACTEPLSDMTDTATTKASSTSMMEDS